MVLAVRTRLEIETHPSVIDEQLTKVFESFQNLHYATGYNESRDFNEIMNLYFRKNDIHLDYNINHLQHGLMS